MERGSLSGQVVVVTGTSQGIGAGIAAAIVDAGGRVVGVSRRPIAPRGLGAGSFLAVEADVTSDGAPEVALAGALDHFGRVDALVNNAGIHRSAPCWEQSDDDFDDMFDVNVTAPFRFAQRFAQHWVANQQRAVILNLCSVESDIGWLDPPQAVYAATKGALLGLTRVLALDLSSHGIRCVAVGPGAIDTGMSEDDRSETEARIPLDKRYGSPGEVGDAAVFLLSDAARYITGEILYVDGGYRLP
ncbi:MAG: SDR family NAD(P)-dependent oxidoreductase [Acidimicrobiaceae bacterium]|nr:SDR family NAD(P)-dependent oxidoreductase [Acidimicrobiaceae bacterium]